MYCIPLNDSTEARYAEIARKMLETKDWITLWHDYGQPFWAKPPLSTWLSACSMYFFGINAFAARLPSLLLSIAMLGLTGLFTKRNFDNQTAYTQILILASSLFFFIDAGAVMTDPSLLFCTTLSCLAFFEACEKNNLFSGYLFFASIGIGLLAKGPLILVLSGLPILAWLLFYKKTALLWKNLPWISGSILLLAIALPWYILAEEKTPGFLNYFIIGEHFGRFLIPGWTGDKYGFAHHQPLGMIWIYFIVGFLPWSISALYLAIYYKVNKVFDFFREQPFYGYLLLWICLPLLFFSFARNIIYTYSFTTLPPASLLFATLIHSFGQYKKWEKCFFILATVSGILSLIITGSSLIWPEKINNTQKEIIHQWNQHSQNSKNKIMYWSKSKSYSAEFYSQGKVSYILQTSDLKVPLCHAEICYIVINKQDFEALFQPWMKGVKKLYCDNKKILLSIKS